MMKILDHVTSGNVQTGEVVATRAQVRLTPELKAKVVSWGDLFGMTLATLVFCAMAGGSSYGANRLWTSGEDLGAFFVTLLAIVTSMWAVAGLVVTGDAIRNKVRRLN